MNNYGKGLMKEMTPKTLTENGAITYETSNSACLDLFASIGSLRNRNTAEVIDLFEKAYQENPDIAMRTLFFARDIRGGLGERKIFRNIIGHLVYAHSESIIKNLKLIPEFGRWDDMLYITMASSVENEITNIVRKQLAADIDAYRSSPEAPVSLLAKWMPSINASNAATRQAALVWRTRLELSSADYRKILSRLRERIGIIENKLRLKSYDFDYSKQPSKAVYKYKKAFLRNDQERYTKWIQDVAEGKSVMNIRTLYPYDIVREIIKSTGLNAWSTDSIRKPCEDMKKIWNTTWNNLEDFTCGDNAVVVMDGSGSMYSSGVQKLVSPIDVAISLAIYFAERNNCDAFRNHFISFSEHPRMVNIGNGDIVDKVMKAAKSNDISNTNIQAVFDVLLKVAVEKNVAQEELPETIYVISDMEFDMCGENSATNFELAKAKFESHGYKLPRVVFWNVDSRNNQQPVTMNETGVALVSGMSPRIFSMMKSGVLDPYSFMMETLNSERYSSIEA